MARRNTYKEDEVLETPFEFRHLLRSFVYIKKYAWRMGLAFFLSALGGIMGLFGPMITQKALDDAIPNKNIKIVIIVSQITLSYCAIPEFRIPKPPVPAVPKALQIESNKGIPVIINNNINNNVIAV